MVESPAAKFWFPQCSSVVLFPRRRAFYVLRLTFYVVPFSCPMSMLIVHVHVRVKPEAVEAFKQASVANARESRKEPGIARFDVAQHQDDPTRFVLVEVYRTTQA